MSVYEFNSGTQLLAVAMDIFSRYGVSVTIGSDFNEYNSLIKEQRSHQRIGPPFDPELYDLDETNAFWLVARDLSGRLIHTQAMRLIPLGNGSLADYLKDNFRAFPPVSIDLNLEESRFRPGPWSKRIDGLACYHGELWIDNSIAAYRGTGLSTILTRYAYLTCLQRLDPDYLFGFVARPVAFKGLAERIGFMHNEPGSLRWHLADGSKVLEGFMVWMARDDMHHILSIPVNELVSDPPMAIAAE